MMEEFQSGGKIDISEYWFYILNYWFVVQLGYSKVIGSKKGELSSPFFSS